MDIMLTQKIYSTLVVYLFASMFVALIAGCSSGSGDQAATEITPVAETPVAETPVSEHYIDIEAIPAPIVAVRVGQVATLVDNKSYAISTEFLSYSWSFSYKPDGSSAKLQDATTATPSFVADVRGVYMVQLLVSAEGVSSQRAVSTVVATIDPERPTGPFNHPGLSSNCVSCHNAVNRKGNGELISYKLPDHIATSNMCQACHTPLAFAITSFVDHQEVFGNCSECHNGNLAIGKSVLHTATDAECDECHNTTHFLDLEADGSFDHSSNTSSRVCARCHNGAVATGKTPTPTDIPPGTHPDTNSECGYCHTTTSFLNAYPDHTGPAVTGAGITCNSCHNGAIAAAQTVGHPLTDSTIVDCNVCHSIVTFSLGGVFNHSLVDPAVQPCESCHNDDNSINAPGKASALPAHPVLSCDCGSCHNTESFTGAFVDHTGIVDNCGFLSWC